MRNPRLGKDRGLPRQCGRSKQLEEWGFTDWEVPFNVGPGEELGDCGRTGDRLSSCQ